MYGIVPVEVTISYGTTVHRYFKSKKWLLLDANSSKTRASHQDE